MSNLSNHVHFQTIQAIVCLCYGIQVDTIDKTKSPLSFDEFDLWLGEDMDYYIDTYLARVLEEIEEDMLSVWSTNKSEQES